MRFTDLCSLPIFLYFSCMKHLIESLIYSLIPAFVITVFGFGLANKLLKLDDNNTIAVSVFLISYGIIFYFNFKDRSS